MTNFTIKLSSPNDYEASQPSGGRTDIHRTLQYVLNIGYRRPSFNKVMLNWTMLKCKVKGKTTAKTLSDILQSPLKFIHVADWSRENC